MRERVLFYAFCVAALTIFTLTIAVVIAGWAIVTVLAPIALWAALVAGVATGIALLINKCSHGVLSIVERIEGIIHTRQRHTLAQHIALTRVPGDHLGNYPVLLAHQTPHLYLPPGNTSHAGRATKVQEVDSTLAPSVNGPMLTFKQLLADGTVQRAQSQGLMLLGYEHGQLRYGSWLDLYSCAIGGVAGTGKTTTVRFLLFQAALGGAKFIMIDPHIDHEEESLAAQFKAFRNVHIKAPCGDNPADVEKRVKWLAKEYLRRKHGGIKQPAIIFVVDELNEIMRVLSDDLRRELADLLLTIAQSGRKFGIFALLMGQRWSEQDLGGKNIGASIRSSLASVMAHRFTDEDQAKKLIGGRNGAKCLELEQGHRLFRDTHGTISLMVTPDTTVEDGAIIQRLLDGESTRESTPESTINYTETTLKPDLHIVPSERETTPENTETTELHSLAMKVMRLQADGKRMPEIMRQIWDVTPGPSPKYAAALQEWDMVMRFIAERLGA